MKALDFFCGCGGLTRGLTDAGLKIMAGFDIDENCRETYMFNNPNTEFIAKDIHDITISDLKKYARLRSFRDALFVGCAPCQPFSPQRKGEKRVKDAKLLSEFGRLVDQAEPGFILIENVPGIARVQGFSTFRRFLHLLKNNGYTYEFEVVDAKYFGVPQTRRRLVLVASKHDHVSLPKRKYGNKLRPLKTVYEAISHFPPIEAGESHPDVPNHFAAAVSEINLERLRNTPKNGGDRRSWPKELWLDCHKGKYSGHTDVYGRMAWHSPAPTLTGRCHSISNGRYGHPEQNRAISLREAASLQSFPNGYIFFGSNKHIAQQIGNAVPVRLAEELGKHILYMNNPLWFQEQEIPLL